MNWRIGGAELLPATGTGHAAAAARSAAYLEPLLREGPAKFIDNAEAAMALAVGDGHVVPLVRTEGRTGNSDICDLHTHHVRYLVMQSERRGRPWHSRFVRLRNLPADLLFLLGSLDRVLYLNNFLFSTNPRLDLTPEQIAQLTGELIGSHARHLLLVRSVNPDCDPAGSDALLHAGYRLIRNRTVYLFDPASDQVLRRRNNRIDARLLDQSPYRFLRDRKALTGAAPRITALYRDLYLHKHPLHNPAFNERFFAHMLAQGTWEFAALEMDGQIDGFMSFFVDRDYLVGSAIGYDLDRPRDAGLYRLIIAWLLREARRRDLKVNLSAGADEFKTIRGGQASIEFDAVYDKHLPARSRFAVGWLRTAVNQVSTLASQSPDRGPG